MKFALLVLLAVASNAQEPVFGGKKERSGEAADRSQPEDPWQKHPVGPPLPRAPYAEPRYDPYGYPDYGYGAPMGMGYGMGGPYETPEQLKFRQEQQKIVREQRKKEMKRRQKLADLEIERQYDPLQYAIDKQKFDQKESKRRFEEQ